VQEEEQEEQQEVGKLVMVFLVVASAITGAAVEGVYILAELLTNNPPEIHDLKWWRTATVTTVVAGFVAWSIFEHRYISSMAQRRQLARDRVDRLSKQVTQSSKQLTRTLADIARISDGLQREIDSRRDVLERLQREASAYQKLARINRNSAEALDTVMDLKFKGSEHRSFLIGIGINATFFLLNIVWAIFWN
jgi:hypothetical protein